MYVFVSFVSAPGNGLWHQGGRCVVQGLHGLELATHHAFAVVADRDLDTREHHAVAWKIFPANPTAYFQKVRNGRPMVPNCRYFSCSGPERSTVGNNGP